MIHTVESLRAECKHMQKIVQKTHAYLKQCKLNVQWLQSELSKQQELVTKKEQDLKFITQSYKDFIAQTAEREKQTFQRTLQELENYKEENKTKLAEATRSLTIINGNLHKAMEFFKTQYNRNKLESRQLLIEKTKLTSKIQTLMLEIENLTSDGCPADTQEINAMHLVLDNLRSEIDWLQKENKFFKLENIDLKLKNESVESGCKKLNARIAEWETLAKSQTENMFLSDGVKTQAYKSEIVIHEQPKFWQHESLMNDKLSENAAHESTNSSRSSDLRRNINNILKQADILKNSDDKIEFMHVLPIDEGGLNKTVTAENVDYQNNLQNLSSTSNSHFDLYLQTFNSPLMPRFELPSGDNFEIVTNYRSSCANDADYNCDNNFNFDSHCWTLENACELSFAKPAIETVELTLSEKIKNTLKKNKEVVEYVSNYKTFLESIVAKKYIPLHGNAFNSHDSNNFLPSFNKNSCNHLAACINFDYICNREYKRFV